MIINWDIHSLNYYINEVFILLSSKTYNFLNNSINNKNKL